MYSKFTKLVMIKQLLKAAYRKFIIRGSSGIGALKRMWFTEQQNKSIDIT